MLFLSEQITYILRFFLSKNIRIARERAWDQTVASRGKGPEFWQPYVEEYAVPPKIGGWRWEKWVGNSIVRMVLMRGAFLLLPWFSSRYLCFFVGVLLPLNFYPFVGVAISAYLKSISTARYLHNQVRGLLCILCVMPTQWHFKQYFAAKRMNKDQIAVFMEERKWHYRGKLCPSRLTNTPANGACRQAFGFAAALLEGLPIIGLVFSISNRVGAAMWAHGTNIISFLSSVIEYKYSSAIGWQTWKSGSTPSLQGRRNQCSLHLP